MASIIERRIKSQPRRVDPRLITGSGVPRPKIGPQWDEATETLIDYGTLEEQRLARVIQAAIIDLGEIAWLVRPGEDGGEILAEKVEAMIRNLEAAQA